MEEEKSLIEKSLITKKFLFLQKCEVKPNIKKLVVPHPAKTDFLQLFFSFFLIFSLSKKEKKKRDLASLPVYVWLVAPVIRMQLAAKLTSTLLSNISEICLIFATDLIRVLLDYIEILLWYYHQNLLLSNKYNWPKSNNFTLYYGCYSSGQV